MKPTQSDSGMSFLEHSMLSFAAKKEDQATLTPSGVDRKEALQAA